MYCAITALDRYPSHLDNIHYIWLATLIYALPPSTDHGHHFHLRHSSHPPFASGRHLLTPKPSHLSHVIGSSVTGTAITSACQEAKPDSVVPPLLRQAVKCGRKRDNGHSKWRQKCHSGTIRVPLMEIYLKDTIRFTWMYPPFLTSTLASKGLHS